MTFALTSSAILEGQALQVTLLSHFVLPGHHPLDVFPQFQIQKILIQWKEHEFGSREDGLKLFLSYIYLLGDLVKAT